MALAIVDTCVMGASWFREVLKDIQDKKGVVFVFTRHEKMWTEVTKSERYLQLFKNARDSGRLLEVSEDDCAEEILNIEADATWNGCGACDDPHIFALASIAKVDYVFTDDKRIGVCRATVRTTIGRRYCKFKLIHGESVFNRHRHKIIS